jgi:glutathione-regulated potassium-efflux system ancillary protein KefG
LKKILILFAHPAFQKSRVNRILVDKLDDIDGIIFHDLYQSYPEMDINVEIEQNLLLQSDIIIFHHPFFWYNTPAILKEWQDLVLEHGWAYGSKGNALKNKWFFNVITTGGQKKAYQVGGYNNFTIRQLLAPIEQTVNLCKMIFLPPFVVHGTHSIKEDEVIYNKEKYVKLLMLVRDDQIDLPKIIALNYLNDYLE